MEANNRVANIIAATVVLTVLAVRVQSGQSHVMAQDITEPSVPQVPVAPQTTSVPTPPPSIVYPATADNRPQGGLSPARQYGVQAPPIESDDEVDNDPNEVDEAPVGDYPVGPDVTIDLGDDYSDVQPGILSDREILNQTMAAMDPDQRAAFAAQWMTMSADERAAFFQEMQGE